MRNHIIGGLIAFGVAFLTVLLFGELRWFSSDEAAVVVVQQQADDRVVFQLPVTGWASSEVPADRAVVTMGVVTEAPTVAEAVTANNEAMQTVFENLEAFGVTGGDLNTSAFRIVPIYNTPLEDGEDLAITGFQAQNNLAATFKDLTVLGPALDAALQSGSNRLIGVRFLLSERRALQARLQTDAILDARTQAERIAEAADLELGRLVAMNVGAGNSRAPATEETFIITGSRIARTDVTGENPVTIYSGEDLRTNGLNNLGESLRQALSTGSGGFVQDAEGGEEPAPLPEQLGEIPVGAVAISAGDQSITASVTMTFEFLRPEDDEDEE